MTIKTDIYPKLDPQQHALMERFVGHKLSNDEAQQLINETVIRGTFKRWALEGR
jgi:hypothetical protein